MFRAMLINPVLLLLAMTIVLVAGRAMGLNPHSLPIFVAGGIALLASEAALVPALLSRHAAPAEGFLRAFFGTVLHLALAVVLAAVAIFTLKLGGSFVFWLLGAYWITLTGLCVTFVRMLRATGNPASSTAN
jgi:hypothetical protein